MSQQLRYTIANLDEYAGEGFALKNPNVLAAALIADSISEVAGALRSLHNDLIGGAEMGALERLIVAADKAAEGIDTLGTAADGIANHLES